MRKMVPYVSRQEISKRLSVIFPEGTPHRNYCIRDTAAVAIFAMLYIDAVEGSSVYLAPVDIYRMTEEQADLGDEANRRMYAGLSRQKKGELIGKRLYADNSREPIRDESIREGLIPLGAIKALPGLPTTSNKPRYYLEAEFAGLFDPDMSSQDFLAAAGRWREAHLSPQALMRMRLASITHQTEEGKLSIQFPNGMIHSISYGPSEIITKAVIEDFARRFLRDPGVLWLSTSKRKVIVSQLEMARSIGLNIDVQVDLPDVILVDMGPAHPFFVFVEVVHSDGPVTERRKDAMQALTGAGGIERRHVAFVTAYADRESGAFSKTAGILAWDSFAWFMSEPERLVVLRDGTFLSDLS